MSSWLNPIFFEEPPVLSMLSVKIIFMNAFAITHDIDWAPDFVIDFVAELLIHITRGRHGLFTCKPVRQSNACANIRNYSSLVFIPIL
jgi:hypothetical protein